MAYVNSEGARLHAEETGRSGTPIVFVHEFAGDCRNWEQTAAVLGRAHRCVAFNARGYPPSDVPTDPALYSQRHAVEDIRAVLDHFGFSRAHIVGLSMGGYATVNFGIAHPDRVLSLTVVGAGHGSDPTMRDTFLKESAAMVERLETHGMAGMGDYMQSQVRGRFRERDPRGFARFLAQLQEHSAVGTALTARGCQLKRLTIYELEEGLRKIPAPTLVVTGDDDTACIDPALFMKRCIPDARLWIVPRTTHNVNLEEPDLFNRVVGDFIAEVDAR
ncbi:MAG TPA: alpha/beta hydrolase [Rhodoblastus sp.]|nr:alpha/beta hydrolase [Rhodoblastus sp.]